MLPSFDSLKELEAFQSRFDWWIFWGTIVLGVLLASPVSRYRSKVEGRIAELRSAEATAEARKTAEKLESQLEESKLKVTELLEVNKGMADKMASRADILTPQVRSQLAAQLKDSLPSKSIAVVGNRQTSEANHFSNALIAAFTTADCLLKYVHIDGDGILSFSGSEGGIENGVVVLHSGESPSPFAAALVNALEDTGIPDISIVPNGDEFPDGALAYLYVLKK